MSGHIKKMRGSGVLGLAVLFALGSLPLGRRAPFLSSTVATSLRASAPERGQFEGELRAAVRWRKRAKLAVNRDREALEAWDPAAGEYLAPGSGDPEAWRLGQMAADRGGDLRHARQGALRAGGMAQTPEERYRAAELLVLIEHELGHHKREFQQARLLVTLRPRSSRTLSVPRRVAGCSSGPRLPGWLPTGRVIEFAHPVAAARSRVLCPSARTTERVPCMGLAGWRSSLPIIVPPAVPR